MDGLRAEEPDYREGMISKVFEMEDGMDTVYVVLVVIAVAVVLTLISKRQRDQSWQGTVTDISKYTYRRNQDDDQCEEGRTISYQQDTGKRGKIKVQMPAFQKYFSDLQVGDRLIKEKGEYMPRIVR